MRVDESIDYWRAIFAYSIIVRCDKVYDTERKIPLDTASKKRTPVGYDREDSPTAPKRRIQVSQPIYAVSTL